MIDPVCNYLNPYTSASALAVASMPTQSLAAPPTELAGNDLTAIYNNNNSNTNSSANNYNNNNILATTTTTNKADSLKMEMQYPPQASSTGSASPNSSIQSAPSSASVSPSIFPTSAQSFACISSSPLSAASTGTASSVSPLSGSPAVPATQATNSAANISAAAVASAAYSWNTYSALPARPQFPYSQYTSDYYGNVGMSASAAAANAWFSHQDRLYHQSWPSQTYAGFNFDDIAFQTQLQRRSVRCTCPNCTNEMSGLPPIVGPDERGRKQHICHIPGCERLYGKASHLKTHLRWHTGERPFLCLTCGKRFSRSDELQRHGRTHTNYRPYACPICSKKFSRSDHLSKHKKTHFKDKKSRKVLAAEHKEEETINTNADKAEAKIVIIKQEKNAETTEKQVTNEVETARNKSFTRSTTATAPAQQVETAAATTAAGDIPLKTEQPDTPASYNPYTNFYHHQSSSLFHPLSTTAPYSGSQQTFDLWNTHHHHHHHQTHAHQHQSTVNNLSSSQQPAQQQQNQQQQQQQQQQQLQPQQNLPTSSYAALALQSESQLAAEYGLRISSPNSQNCNNSSSIVNNLQVPTNSGSQAASTYSSLIGHMKSEYANYSDFSSSSASVAAPFHHAANHNPWAMYQHSHAAA